MKFRLWRCPFGSSHLPWENLPERKSLSYARSSVLAAILLAGVELLLTQLSSERLSALAPDKNTRNRQSRVRADLKR